MNLLGSSKSKITKDENGKNLLRLGISEVVLIHCNIVNKDYQRDSRFLYTSVPNKLFGQLVDTSPKIFIFLKTQNLTQNFHILKYGLLIKILNHLRSL